MRLTVTAHLTLDGVTQSNGKPEPELNDGFEQGGWQVPYFDEDMDRLTGDWIAAASAFLLGRKTYELFAGKPEYGSATPQHESDVVKDSVSRQTAG